MTRHLCLIYLKFTISLSFFSFSLYFSLTISIFNYLPPFLKPKHIIAILHPYLNHCLKY
uniref:Uncharacterized protein n=1 Tax=Solanum lycopersicum TaxID=4081 RepID=A0A3Q7G419_SOLLC